MLRFTIRELLWLMVVVGLAVGWWVEHRKALLDEQAQRKLATYRRAMIKMGQYVKEKTGEPAFVQVLDDVL